MGFGGMSPFPKKLGGGKSRIKALTDALGSARGSAYTTDTQSVVYVENMMAARAISAAWATNQRLANNWDPKRTTSLSRWETILALPPSPNDTEAKRRRRVEGHLALFGTAALYTTLYNALAEALGPVLKSLEFITPAVANVHVPDGSYPWGTVVSGITWYSTVAHILVWTQRPANYSTADYWATVGKVADILDPLVPAHCTFNWYHSPTVGAPVDVTGGPHGAGFYLDEPNLDQEVFSV